MTGPDWVVGSAGVRTDGQPIRIEMMRAMTGVTVQHRHGDIVPRMVVEPKLASPFIERTPLWKRILRRT